jgi:RNA polymerase sigma-70 factor (ECF subfamily)
MQIIDDRIWGKSRNIRTDHEWIRLLGYAQKGDRAAVDRLATDILEYVKKRVRVFGVHPNDAADVAQACTLEVLRHLEDFDPTRGRFDGWMTGFALNSARTYNRGTRRQKSEVALEDVAEPSTEDMAVSAQRTGLAAALDKLSKEDQLLLGYKFGLGMTSDEVGIRMGMTGTQVRKRVSRALERLRQQPAIRELLNN